MAQRIAALIEPARFGVKAAYVFGSTKNATAGPASDIDLLLHVEAQDVRRGTLAVWLDGWSGALAEMNELRTGYRSDGLLDLHYVTDEDIARGTSYAAKIGAVTDAARPLTLAAAVTKITAEGRGETDPDARRPKGLGFACWPSFPSGVASALSDHGLPPETTVGMYTGPERRRRDLAGGAARHVARASGDRRLRRGPPVQRDRPQVGGDPDREAPPAVQRCEAPAFQVLALRHARRLLGRRAREV